MNADEYNRRVAQALRRARAILGDNKGAPFARRLKERYGAPSETTYLRWEAQKQEIPGWALIAAAELAGVTIEDLLQERATRPVLERLDAFEVRMERMEAQANRLEQILTTDASQP